MGTSMWTLMQVCLYLPAYDYLSGYLKQKGFDGFSPLIAGTPSLPSCIFHLEDLPCPADQNSAFMLYLLGHLSRNLGKRTVLSWFKFLTPNRSAFSRLLQQAICL